MKLEFACRVDIGIRESNDDRALIPGKLLNMQIDSVSAEAPAAAIVCDGCGGYDGGGVAAETVLQTVAQALPETLADPKRLAQVLEAAKEAVFAKKEELPQFSAMCTTVAGCVFREEATVIFHAGDSRVYRFDGNRLARMTVDHSLVRMMIDLGRITEEESRTDPRRNVINRCIGIDCEAPEIYVTGPIEPGEIWLLCSDGLWEALEDERIRMLLDMDFDLQEKADLLVREALRRGSDDNTTACLITRPGERAERESTPFILD